jgi:uncharacterized protein (DUF1800 family)
MWTGGTVRAGALARGLVLVCASLALGAWKCPGPDRSFDEHVLSRIGYGPDPWSLARVAALKPTGYIKEQLEPERIDDSAFEALLAAYPSQAMSYRQLAQAYRDDNYQVLEELKQAHLLRAVASRRQLEAVLTDFWFDHFNVFAPEGPPVIATTPYVRDAIRAHVLGRFEDMLVAVARSPAMLFYLDAYKSTRVFSDRRGNTWGGINENYARELMELHTIGVDAGYLHDDVVEVARCFTGWTFEWDPQDTEDGFVFDAWSHDDGEKRVLGTLVVPAGGGVEDGLAVLRHLARHPRTAARVARLLAQRFVHETPPQGLVDRAAAVFLSSEGDLREVMRTLLLSEEFLTQSRQRAKVKRPFVFMASLLRATGASFAASQADARDYLRDLDEVPFEARPPVGYPDASPYWAGSGSLITRINAAERFARRANEYGIVWGVAGGTSQEIVDALARRLFPGGTLSGQSRDAAIAYVDTLSSRPAAERVWSAAAMLLAAPEFMRH